MNIHVPPALKQFAEPLMQRGLTRWRSLPLQGQRVVLVVTAIVLLGLGWALVYAPIQSSRDRNKQRIATLQAQYMTMQDQSAELAKLRQIAPVAATRNQTLADQNGLQAIFGAEAKVAMAASGEFRIVMPNVSYVEWLDRVDQTLARFRLRIVRMDIKRQETAATANLGAQNMAGTPVSAEIVFVDASRGTGSTGGTAGGGSGKIGAGN